MKQATQKISSFSIIVLFVCLSLIGLGLLYYVPFQSSATTELPRLTVTFSMRKQYTPRIVENEVTNKLEQALSRTEGLSKIVSVSYENGGRVEMSMLSGTNMRKARFLVITNINKVWDQISDLCYYPSVRVSTTGGSSNVSFMSYSVRANSTMSELSHYVDEKIKPILAQVKGVEEVRFNKREPAGYLLKYNQTTLDNMNISLQSIVSAIQQSDIETVLGLLPYTDENGNTSTMRFYLSNETDPADLLKLQVASSGGTLIPLSALVSIAPDDDNEDSSQRINGQNTIFVYIVTKAEANQMLVSRNIKKAMQEVFSELPQGYHIELESDMSETLEYEVVNIGVRLVLTIIIIIAFIFLTVRNVRLVLDILLSLLIAMLIAFIGYFAFDVEINMYALAAITISSNLMIDNIIVMSNQVIYRRNINAFMPMFTATITTVGSLAIVFFVGETQKARLTDFATVLIINLAASLFVATFFVPALLKQTGLTDRNHTSFTPLRLKALRLFNRCYERIIRITRRLRVPLCILLVLAFGLPIFMLPVKIDERGRWADLYNDIFGTQTYNEKIRPFVDKWIGGSLYRFNSYNPVKEDDEQQKKLKASSPTIYIGAKLPAGASRDMLEVPIKRIERFLASKPDIKQFNTFINGNSSASIQVYFEQSALDRGAAITLRQQLITEALTISGLTWSIGGPGNLTFTNTPIFQLGKYDVTMMGYNFDQLMRYANLFCDSLEVLPRVHNTSIVTSFNIEDNTIEPSFNISPQSLDKYGISITDVTNELARQYGNETTIRLNHDGTTTVLNPRSNVRTDNDIWAMMNTPLNINGNDLKLSDLGTFDNHNTPLAIVKQDQQYTVFIHFDYKGSESKASDMLTKKVKSFNNLMSMGYEVKENFYGMYRIDTKHTVLILLIIVGIIFVTSCVLLNSLLKPFAIILVIPISFIGVFLAFSELRLPFGDGGMASMVLLCGLAVNANIYLTYEYIEVRRKNPRLNQAAAFVKAWNHKIGPVFLTIVSTMLGFLPFVIDNNSSDFWYALSAGTIAGLATTAVGIFLFLPMFLVKIKKK